jgi:hypothetical protein
MRKSIWVSSWVIPCVLGLGVATISAAEDGDAVSCTRTCDEAMDACSQACHDSDNEHCPEECLATQDACVEHCD